ncbi:hypothetical protein KJ903_02435 [Patescibacteria group bacterium]|nr:hypothetical protein [Patescibacteria group bacterium]
MEKRKEEKILKQPTLNWEKVEAYVNEKDKGGAAMAVIETEKIFDEVLKRRNFPGKTTDQRIHNARGVFSDYEALQLARDVYKKLSLEVAADIKITDIKEILSAYHQAVKDLTKIEEKELSFFDKIILFFRHYINAPRKLLKRAALGTISFFFIIFILDSTSAGRWVVSALVKTSHILFGWVLLTLLLILGVVIIVVGGVLYFESRKKRSKLRIEKN